MSNGEDRNLPTRKIFCSMVRHDWDASNNLLASKLDINQEREWPAKMGLQRQFNLVDGWTTPKIATER